jgi:chromosome segregation ATPase
MTDRNLEEAIFQLQKLNTENGVKSLVEEAAQLFASGRHIEAGALMEKAEAMIAAKSGKPVPANPAPLAASHAERAKFDDQAMAQMAGRLADGLSKILTGAFEELERHVVGESRKISFSFGQQLDRLQATVDSLQQLPVRFEQVNDAVSQQRSAAEAIAQKYEQLSTGVTTLEGTSSRHEKEIGSLRVETTALRAEAGALRGETTALRTETKDLASSVTQQMEGLSGKIGSHQEELTGLKSTVSEISRKVAGFIERVDRQGEVIRSITDTQVRRAAALDELLGVLTRLKAPTESMIAAAAGQL